MKITIETPAWRLIKYNWLITLTNKFVIACVVLSCALIILFWNKLPPLVPLWFSRPWGSDQLAPTYMLFVFPISSVLLYAINLLISMYLTTGYLIFTQILFITSLFGNIISFIALVKIIFLVI